MTIQNLLQQAGLDRHEIALYLTLVQEGENKAGKLAKKSNVPRTYAYKVLESLISKGMVRSIDSARSVRSYAITDYQAPQRYLEKRQFELYRAQQEAQSLAMQLEVMANPQVPSANAENLKGEQGEGDFWRLLHSTITREIIVVNPPSWWGDGSFSSTVKKWEQHRAKQHIWERRWEAKMSAVSEADRFTERHTLKTAPVLAASLVLIDQYLVAVTCWQPFRALRIESPEMVSLQKALL